MKQHKHAKLIKDWADGAQIEFKCGEEWVDFMAGTNNWHECIEYRIKPREFEKGASYPVTLERGLKYIATYTTCGDFYLTGLSGNYSIDELTWIGDKLEIDWPKETN